MTEDAFAKATGTKDKRQKTKDKRQKTKDKRQKTKDKSLFKIPNATHIEKYIKHAMDQLTAFYGKHLK